MISPEISKAVNAQIAHEQANAHAYRAVACYFKRLNLHGFDAFFRKQAGEETTHAEKLIDHLEERGGKVELQSVPAPRSDFASAVEAVKAVAEMERKTSRDIHALYELALAQKDHALAAALQWFINEQVEEEAWADELEAVIQQIGGSGPSLFMLDHRWAEKHVKE
jgi:ferritin